MRGGESKISRGWRLTIASWRLMRDDRTTVVLIAISAVAFVFIGAFANATRQVFNLALYRYATGLETPGFSTVDLEEPFKRRRSRGD